LDFEKMTFRILSRQSVLKSFVGLLILFYMIRYQSTANDFAVYTRAGEDFRAKVNPWSFTGDVNNSYLYGPLTTILISIYTIIPIGIGIGVLRLITLLGLALVAMRLTSTTSVQKLSILGIALLCFPVRANLEYGNFTVLLVCAGVLVAPFMSRIKPLTKNKIIFGVFAAIAFDYKPHLFFPVAAIAIIWNGRSRVSFILTIALGFLSTSLFLQENVFGIWISSIQNRVSGSSESKPDQMDAHSIISQVGFVIPQQTYILLTLTLICGFFSLKKSALNVRNLLTSVALVFPFLHSSDLGILIVIFLLTRSELIRTNSGSAAIGLFAVWSDSFSIAALTLVGILFFFYFIDKKRIPYKQLIMILGPNIVFFALVFTAPVSEEIARHLFNFIGILVFIKTLNPRNENLTKFTEKLIMKMPIFIHSAGGFGNRLFAISYCHYLQSQLNRKVFLNLDGAPRFLLKYIDSCEHIDRDKFRIGKLLLLGGLALRKIRVKIPKSTFFIFDDSYRFEDAKYQTSSIYISGFYQNAEYVLKNSSDWAGELIEVLNADSSSKIAELRLNVDYHAMHIRRGDLMEVSEQRGVLSLDYYSQDSQQHGSSIVILTDASAVEIEKIKVNFPNAAILGPELNVDAAYLIMMNANTFTPGNSTLSWFAALHRYLLGTAPGKLPFPFFEAGPPSEQELGGNLLATKRSFFIPKNSLPKSC